MIFKSSVLILLFLLVIGCDNEGLGKEVPTTLNNLVGQWQLTQTYISPGGATEWVDVTNGYSYVFNSNGTYQQIEDNTTLEEGTYRIEEDNLFLDFESDGEEKILGFFLEITDKTITLSPSFPSICIEGCLYRYRKR